MYLSDNYYHVLIIIVGYVPCSCIITNKYEEQYLLAREY